MLRMIDFTYALPLRWDSPLRARPMHPGWGRRIPELAYWRDFMTRRPDLSGPQQLGLFG